MLGLLKQSGHSCQVQHYCRAVHRNCDVKCLSAVIGYDMIIIIHLVSLAGIGRWYGQAGTPHLHIKTQYNAAAKTFTITARQSTPPTNGQPNKIPVLIPLKVRLAACGTLPSI